MFPPSYSDCGKNITLGKNVFINSGCRFQDQGGITIGDNSLIGHNAVLATLNHSFAPEDHSSIYPSPITINMRDYGGFEKFGELNRTLPQNNERITTQSSEPLRQRIRLLLVSLSQEEMVYLEEPYVPHRIVGPISPELNWIYGTTWLRSNGITE